MQYRAKLHKRGSISVLRGSKLVPALQFMFNPAEVIRGRGWVHGSAPVPGRSSPFYGGGYGDADTFSFTIPLDADRGFLEARRQGQIADPSDVERWSQTISDINSREDLRLYMDAFKSFLLPESKPSRGTSSLSVPQRIWIDLGSALSGEVQFDSIEERMFRFSNTMTVMKADLTLTGHVIEESNRTSSESLRQYTSQGGELPNVVQNATFVDLPDVTDTVEVEDLF